MNRLFTKKYLFLFTMLGIAVNLFFGYSGCPVLAQNNKPTQQEIIQIEENAANLRKIWKEETVRQSAELFEKAAVQWENFGNSQNSARCLREVVKIKLMLAEEKSAVRLLNKALLFEQKSRNIAGEAETLSLLTIVSLRLDENETSRIYHSQALDKAGKSQQPKVLARFLFASGAFFYNQRNFPKMLEQLEKALQLFREVSDKEGEAEILIELAYSYIINNNRINGRDSAQKSLEIAKNISNTRIQTFALVVLGDAYQRMGEWQSALKAFSEAENLFPDNLDFFEKGILFNRLGFYNLAYNELNQAKKYFQKSYENFDRIGNAEGRSELLTELGQIAVQQENNQEAMNYFKQSRQIAEKSNDPISLGVLNLKIGEVYYNLGDLSASEKYLRNSLQYYKKIGISYRIAEVLEKIGRIYERKENYSLAGEYYFSALEMNRKVLSKFAQAQNLFDLARLDTLRHRNNSALENIKQSITLTESSRGETANNQLKRLYIENVFERYELYINLLMQNPNENYAIEALQAVEKSRARLMLENLSLSEANFTKDADAETVRGEKEIRGLLNTKADKLTDLLSQNADKKELDKLDAEIRELENELEEIKAKLKQSSPIYSAIKNPAPFDVAEFQNNVLDENSLLLEFSFGKDESYLWLIGKTEINSYVLPPREQIERHIQTLRELLNRREVKSNESVEDYQKRIADIENNYWLDARVLSDQLFGQITDKLSNKRLIIVPDGKLNYFPVAALPLLNSDKNEPILLTNETVYEPSAETLSLLAKIANQSSPATKDLLVFSDPIFSNDDSRISSEDKTIENPNSGVAALNEFRSVESLKSLSRLMASKTETDSIMEIVGRSKSDTFSGFSANREQLLNTKTADYKVIHFATHGYVDEQRPELSGIVLSRFDEKAQELDEFVRLHDIYGLNLNADLVVLSACNTGIGKEVKGEGLMSLNNAFLQVGAKSVVSSLWKVDDNAAQELMKNFYRELTSGKVSTSQALRRAQIKMWRSPQYKSPFYWAAFTLVGDFQTSPKLSAGFGNWIYLLLILPLLLLSGIFHYRRKFRSLYRKAVNNG